MQHFLHPLQMFNCNAVEQHAGLARAGTYFAPNVARDRAESGQVQAFCKPPPSGGGS